MSRRNYTTMSLNIQKMLVLMLFALLSTDIALTAARAQASAGPSTSGQTLPGDELLPLFPDSDLIATIDLPAILTDLLPRLDKLGVKGLSPIANAVSTITTRLGVEPRQLGGSAIGLSFQAFEATGILLIKGLDPDQKAIDELLRLYQIESKVSSYEGVSIVSLLTPITLPSIGPLSLRSSDLAYASLGKGVVAVGDLSAIKKVIDRRKLSTAGGSNATLIAAIRGDTAPAQLRFAFALTPGMREEALSQGDLFRSIAAVSVVQGALRVSPELVTDLRMVMRTGSAGEATELEQGLKGLLNLARVLFANGNQLATDLLNRARVTVRDADVSINLTLPSTFIERMAARTP